MAGDRNGEDCAREAAACLSRQYFQDEGGIITADASAENRAWLQARYPGVTPGLAPSAAVRSAILSRYGEILTHEAVEGLARRTPELSASRVLTRSQVKVLLAAGLLFVFALGVAPILTLRILIWTLSAAFVASGLFRALLAWVGSGAAKTAFRQPPRAGLPLYTILVPLYREAAVLPGLLAALAKLDYPKDRIDLKLVLEEDDAETLAAAERALAADAGFEIIRVPAYGPRTKPKAANYALAFARGEYLVIYDAEDRPEPDQLLKSVAAFRAASRRTACLQARLNFYNADHNWITRMFALDYALWFDVLLPGLDKIGVPMPLGGTSNHFRTQILRDIGGWDAFNVTEDADIGIRLSQLGYRVSMIDSTTYEEAPIALGPWLRQRSRWLKGYMQTWLVHMRHPFRLLRRAGLGGFLAFQLFIGGGVIFALVNPLLWTVFLTALVFHWRLWDDFGGVPAISLLGNNVLLTYLAMLGPRRRGREDLSPYGLTVIVYWAMVSVAGYRGLAQLITRPFFWEKTTHGVMPGPAPLA